MYTDPQDNAAVTGMKYDLNDLYYFVKAVEYGGFSRRAKRWAFRNPAQPPYC